MRHVVGNDAAIFVRTERIVTLVKVQFIGHLSKSLAVERFPGNSKASHKLQTSR